ncbi:centrosomal protein of 72 kDa [Dunckerocampus dactyliophorus]|uniref:centrosomal protein of 72 kDa n=1 Tax=Dunckerocampus dactyliophorus TaxID=161453 RepID=UPI00240648B9|nr:centrosomal protein of 72 kDa [Dunckerocampus dactyliophorus]
MSLTTLTEEWIRKKLGLSHPRLGDVRTLRLPGTYRQKIRHLGKALSNFEGLKSLDLSHNALFSIEGLKHLKRLQSLNLYYNCIPSLEEVKVLFELPVLRELDLRLNPVASEPRYRPIVVQAITSLRMLDACVVTHTERRAARMQLSHHPHPRRKRSSVNQKSRDKALAFVERLSQRLSALTEEDDIVLQSPSPQPGEDPRSLLIDSQAPVPHHPILHPPRLTSSIFNKTDDGSYREPLDNLLDFMDKHWVGERSLQIDSNFLIQIVQIFSMMENHICKRDTEVKALRNEVDALCFCAAAQEREHKSEVCKLTSQLGELNKKLWFVMDDNAALQKELVKVEHEYLKYLTEHPPVFHITDSLRELEDLKEEVEELRKKVNSSGLTGSEQH